MSKFIDKDFLIDLRRNAYIECTENFLTANNVVGIFGDSLPEEIFYACKLIPVPMEGVDSHIFQFGKEGQGDGYCDVIKSTLIYLTTQKCPILYSCRMYVLEDKCKTFYEVLQANTQKLVYVYNNEDDLIHNLSTVFETQMDQSIKQKAHSDLSYIEKILNKIECSTEFDAEEVFLLRYYTKYITDLNARRQFFEKLEKEALFNQKEQKMQKVKCLCPRGNFKNICVALNSNNTRIDRVWDNADYGLSNCPFMFKTVKDYS